MISSAVPFGKLWPWSLSCDSFRIPIAVCTDLCARGSSDPENGSCLGFEGPILYTRVSILRAPVGIARQDEGILDASDLGKGSVLDILEA